MIHKYYVQYGELAFSKRHCSFKIKKNCMSIHVNKKAPQCTFALLSTVFQDS